MCIIIYKSEKTELPTRATLEYCWQKNPDGGGFMYARNNAVHYQKGFLSFRQFYKALKKARVESAAVVIHFRIATHGGKSREMTHPFEITTSTKRLQNTRGTCALAVAHNGILSFTAEKATATLSDTAVFARDYLTRLCRKPTFYKDTRINEIIGECIGVSRLAIMACNGHVETFGKWYTDNSGVKYSNVGYEKPKYNMYTYTKAARAYDLYDHYDICDTCRRTDCEKCDNYYAALESDYTFYKDTYLDY